jgi:protoporphyrinogen oxidase
MKICVIGGGLCGLTAAFRLSEYADVDLLEKQPVLGGCLSSYPVNNTWIEKFYHHCFEGDQNLFGLMESLGVRDKLEWRPGSTGYYVDGTLYPLTTPLDIIRYPDLTFTDKARLGLLTLRSGQYDVTMLDDTPAKDFIEAKCGNHAYKSFFEPLLKSKFGDMKDSVSAAWLVSRIAIRSNRGAGGERLGYMKGGFWVLLEEMERQLTRRGCAIHLDEPATRIEFHADSWHVNSTPYDAVISTISPQHLAAIGGPDIGKIPYQGAACLTIGLERNVTDGIYWVNMKDEAPYGAVIGHTNFVPRERYAEDIVYLASYFRATPAHKIQEIMLEDFKRRFSVSDEEIHWHRLAVEPAAGPVYITGYRHLIPKYEQKGLFMAGMFSAPNYPERSMEGSVVAGTRVAEKVGRRGE